MSTVDLTLAHRLLCAMLEHEEEEGRPMRFLAELHARLSIADEPARQSLISARDWLRRAQMIEVMVDGTARVTSTGEQFLDGHVSPAERDRLARLVTGLWHANRRLVVDASRLDRESRRNAERARRTSDELSDVRMQLDAERRAVSALSDLVQRVA